MKPKRLLPLLFLILPSTNSMSVAREVPFGGIHEIATDVLGVGAVLAVDLDRDIDGDPDLVAALEDDDKIAWYRNLAGNGSFGSQQVISASADQPRSLDAGDIDGDGDQDLASASGDGQIAWYENRLNEPSNDFGPLQKIPSDPKEALCVHLADFDKDGDLDVLSGGTEMDIVAWHENRLNEMTNDFAPSQTLTDELPRPVSVVTGDMDGNGTLDVIVASEGGDRVAWLSNKGDGTIAGGKTIGGPASDVKSVSVADVDGDGDLDVLAAVAGDDAVVWYENDGSGDFSDAQEITDQANGASHVTAADLDRDGDLDVFATSENDGKVAWFENTDSAGTFGPEKTIRPGAIGTRSVTPADIDNDGDLDVVFASSASIERVFNETIHRSASFPIRHTVDPDFDGARSVYAADMDSDGDVDLLGAATNPGSIAWWENDGTTQVANWTEHVVDDDYMTAVSVHAADINCDGKMDILGASRGDSKVTWWENDGTNNASNWTEHSTTLVFPKSVSAADMDSDGDIDILATSDDNNQVLWFENDGADNLSNWTKHTVDSMFMGASSVYAADIDGDGKTDLIGSAFDGDLIAMWRNDGTNNVGNWTEHTIDASVDGPSSVHAADVDGDSDLDVIASINRDSDVVWWENTRNLSNWPKHTVDDFFGGTTSVYGSDMDCDGDVDIVAAGGIEDAIHWWENDGNLISPTWTEHAVEDSIDNPRSIHVSDMDGDGDMDVLGAASADDDITWWENRGGQFALMTEDLVSFATAVAGTSGVAVLGVTATHRGRVGDSPSELTSLELLLEDEEGEALSAFHANILISSIRVYLDNNSGAFEAGSDSLVTTLEDLSSGTQTITFDDGDPLARIPVSGERYYFVVLDLDSKAYPSVWPDFRITHLTESTSKAEDFENDNPLQLEYTPNVISSTFEIVQQVDFALSHTESVDPVQAGSGLGNLVYQIDVTNHGPSSANTVSGQIALTLPEGATVESISDGVLLQGSNAVPSIIWSIGSLSVDATETTTIAITVDSSAQAGTDVIGFTASASTLNGTVINPDDDETSEFTSILAAPPTDTPTNTPTGTPTLTPTPTETSTNTMEVILTETPTPTEDLTPTPTETSTDGPSPTPTDTPTDGPSPTPTETPVSGLGGYDVQPQPVLDGKIDARDLIEWLQRIQNNMEDSQLLFGFSQYWQAEE
ncbi:MAG: VCBS repeat-containing protein [Candidatus Omnitrophica bacterium]|nr:VCBS repeat-containing protein [Candidatus Omnitrophota bacterium]